MFASLFSSVGGSESSTTEKEDRRRATRQRIDGAGELRACSAGIRTPAMSVEVRDISATGVGIVHDVPLPVGQKYVVKQDLLPPDAPRTYTVVRTETTRDGRYTIGLHASNLLDPHAAKAPANARRVSRSQAALAVTASIVFILAIAALMLY